MADFDFSSGAYAGAYEAFANPGGIPMNIASVDPGGFVFGVPSGPDLSNPVPVSNPVVPAASESPGFDFNSLGSMGRSAYGLPALPLENAVEPTGPNYWAGNPVALSDLGTPNTLAGGKIGWSLSPDQVSKNWGESLGLGTTRFTAAVGNNGLLNLSGAGPGDIAPVPTYDATGKLTGFAAKPTVGGSATVVRNPDGSAQVVLDPSFSEKSSAFAPKATASAVFQLPKTGSGYPQSFDQAGNVAASVAGPKILTIPGAAGKFGDDTKAVTAAYDARTGQWSLAKASPGVPGASPWNDSTGSIVLKDDSASGWTKTDWLAIAPTLIQVLTLVGTYFMAEKQLQQQLKLNRENTETQLQIVGMQYAARGGGGGNGGGKGLRISALDLG